MVSPNGSTKSAGLTLAVVGSGKMGSAVLAGILENRKADAPISRFIASVRSKESALKLQAALSEYAEHLTVLHGDNLEAFHQADIILLACKPYMAESILGTHGVSQALMGKLLISVLAGATPRKLQSYIGMISPSEDDSCHILRATPNMAARIGESMTIIEKPLPDLPPAYEQVTLWMFSQVGKVRYIAPDLFDVGSALAGAGIAFMTIAFDGLLDGSVSEGIKRADATDMLAQTLLGMAKLVAGGDHPAVLREEISSPRGTTIRGLLALEAGNVRSSFSKAIIDATDRAKQM